jgi:hypothetical protein
MAPIPERLAGVTIDLATKERRERRWLDDLIVTAPSQVQSAPARTRPWNDSRPDRLAAMGPGDSIMSDDNPQPPFVYEGLDPAPEPKSTAAEVSEAVKGTVNRIGNAIETGRKPGMPLSILSNIAREAPLGSLLVAFLLGVAIARRR